MARSGISDITKGIKDARDRGLDVFKRDKPAGVGSMKVEEHREDVFEESALPDEKADEVAEQIKMTEVVVRREGNSMMPSNAPVELITCKGAKCDNNRLFYVNRIGESYGITCMDCGESLPFPLVKKG